MMVAVQRRESLDIINAILLFGGGKVTSLRQQLGLNYWQGQRYLARMEQLNLVVLTKDNRENITHFHVTERGKIAIQKIKEFLSWLLNQSS